MSRAPARLWPHGTVAAAFLAARGRKLEPGPRSPRLPEGLAGAVASFDLDDGVLYETWELVRCAPGLEPEGQAAVAYLVAACLVAARRGSTRLPIDSGSVDPILARLGAGRGERARLKAILAGKGSAREGVAPLLGEGDDYKPLILEDGCLYLHRLRAAERRLAGALRGRMQSERPAPEGLEEALGAVLARPTKAGGAEVSLSGEQQRAVLAALSLPLAVVTGGPGTGKTSIVVSILRVLARLGIPLESIALAAPTGKAANRMEQAIRKALQSIEPLEGADRALLERCPAPKTLHRLLGYSPAGDRFRHHENDPLAERVVIVDESSMVDLFLMDRLVRAVDPAKARLVLLGDSDQLPSVEAGAVFRDLVPKEGATAAKPWDRLVRAPLPPPGPKAPRGELRAACAVKLTRSFRQDERAAEGQEILEVAARVNDGAAEALRARLVVRERAQDVLFRGVELVPATTQAEREAMLERWFSQRIQGLAGLEALLGETWRLEEGQPIEAQRARLEALCAHYESSRVLCVTRADLRPTGAAAVNEALRRRWLEAHRVPLDDRAPRFLLGEPVMAERNDYERGLFNGDQGLVVRVQEGGGRPAVRALFARREGLVAHPVDGEAGLARCFAMTVHKAQGSEFDSVLVVLPDEDVPLLTREILYTAITRARRSVVLLGDPAILETGVGRPLLRWSGVGERIVRREPRGAR